MKEDLLEFLQIEMEKHIKNMRFSNLKETKENLNRGIDILISFENLSFIEEESLPIEKKISEIKKEEIVENNNPVEKEEIGKEETRKAYRFKRLMRDGTLPELKAFVPESIIRELGLEEGDYVFANFVKHQENGPPLYDFELYKKNEKPVNENRIEENFCIVEYDEEINRLYTERKQNGEFIKIDEVPQKMYISDQDIQKMNVKQGDIVDMAYDKNNPSNSKLVWRYPTQLTIEKQKKPTSYYKEKSDKTTKDVDPIFEGKTIAVIGFKPGHTAMKEEIEKRNGKGLFLTGNERYATLNANISQADIVVLMTEYAKHSGINTSVDIAKEKNVPFKEEKSFGRSSFVRTAHELIKQTN